MVDVSDYSEEQLAERAEKRKNQHLRVDTSNGNLSRKQTIKAIRKHEAVEAVGGLSNAQIDAVIKAYADVIWTACLNNIGVRLDFLGAFKPRKKSGHKGYYRMLAPKGLHQRIGADTPKELTYVEPKPDYKQIVFHVNRTASRQFRALTEEEVVHTEEEDGEEI